ncbi:phage tape measure protein [Lysinibacillus contaminans]|uniref:Phage tape measure protein n=1 Tax=Lysinibacillus contaminans TaxID=1293441 RepID=A0ABR5K0D1_9BACI|nr:tape measure protein [Lysinibacillus contaminans]KOS68372.1 phage tape measure protein [Lysinibacillus contaminans]
MPRKKVRAISVRTTMTLTDRMTGTLQKMMKAMNSTIRAMEQMHTASNRAGDMRSLQRARRDIESASASFERLRASARLAGSEGQNAGARLRNGLNSVRDSANSATSSVRTLLNSLLGFAAAYLSIQGIVNGFNKFTQASDNYSNTNARLSNINDGLQTQAELQDKIYRASQRSLSSYNDTAASVAKLNLLAGKSFASNDEAIRFSELMNKSFSVSGASTQEKQAGMYQLTQAMAAGRLQGDEFRSITENAPLLAQAIADATGVGMEGLKEMSSEGTITADIIKTSLFKAAKDIEEKFKNMPLTFADAMTVFNNWAQKAFEPMFIRFRQFVNSDAFGVLAGHAMIFVNLFVSGLSLVFDALEMMYNTIGAVGQFMYNNAAWVVPILVVMAVVLGSIVAILMTKYAVLGLIRTATLAWAAAQWVVDAAYLASPITWVIIAIIAVIVLVVTAMIMWGEQTATVVGFVAGIFGALGAFIFNVFANIANFLTIFAEFFINLFIDPVYAVKKLFYDLVMMVVDNMSAMAGSFDSAATVLGNAFVSGANIAIKAVNGLINLLNKIPGVDIGTVGELQTGKSNVVTKHWQNFAANLKAPTSDKNVVNLSKTNLMSMPDAFNKANEWAYNGTMKAADTMSGLVDKAKGLAGLGKDSNNKENPFSDTASLMDNVVNTAPSESGLGKSADKDNKLKGGKLDTVGKIEDKINLADEYLELFKDIAEGKAINNIVSLTPNLQVNNTFEDTAGSVLSKVLNKIGDLSNVGGYAAKLNDFVSQSLNAPSRDDVVVSKEVREKVAASPIMNNSKTVVQHVKSEPKFYFTGDINEKVDVEDVVKAITQGLKDEQGRSVEGVYG